MDQREYLLVRTLRDLENKIATDDEYELLRASGLLRQLILDQNPLVHQANRRHGVALTFHVIDSSDDPLVKKQIEDGAIFTSNSDALYPRSQTRLLAEKLRVLTLDQFLGFPVGTIHGSPITVRHAIKHVAHVMGGIHAGAPSAKDDEVLRRLARQDIDISIFGVSVIVRQLRAIGLVVIDGLAPLGAAILSNTP